MHQQPLHADGEPAVGRHPVAESLQVGLEWLHRIASPRQRVQVVPVQVQSLAAGDQLHAAEEQVEGVAVAGPACVGMGVEGPLAHGVAGDEQEVAAVFLLRPGAQPALVLRRQVWLAAHVHAVTLQDQLLGLGKVDVRDRGGDSRQPRAQQFQFRRVAALQRIDDPRDHVARRRHHREVVLDEAELDVKTDVLVDVTGGVVRFCPEHRPDLEDPLEDTYHDLFVELGTLRQVGGTAKVVDLEDVGATLGGRGDDLGRLDLGEATRVERGAEAGHHAGRQPEHGSPRRMAIRHHRVVQQRRQRRLDLLLVNGDRRWLAHRRHHRDGQVMQLDSAGRLRLGHHQPLQRNHRLLSQAGLR